jgi:hypothetical protein
VRVTSQTPKKEEPAKQGNNNFKVLTKENTEEELCSLD